MSYRNIICDFCKTEFQRPTAGRRICKYSFCCLDCRGKHKTLINTKICICLNCGNQMLRRLSTLKSKKYFCSQSCSCTYNNNHKTHGTRRSKLELYIEEQLKIIESDLEIHFNRKDAIGSELDIYIPSLKLAFEINGIFHCKPIYGQEKLNRILENDKKKSDKCLDNKITLYIIDTMQSTFKIKDNVLHFIEKTINSAKLGLVIRTPYRI